LEVEDATKEMETSVEKEMIIIKEVIRQANALIIITVIFVLLSVTGVWLSWFGFINWYYQERKHRKS
jgi:predicted nucleic acid-binding Zn ribbon protein